MTQNERAPAGLETVNTDITFKLNGKKLIIKGLTPTVEGKINNADTKVKSLEGDVSGVKGRLDSAEGSIRANTEAINALKAGAIGGDNNIRVAYKDYSQDKNKESMAYGTYYFVPFNASNQFLQLDPKTGIVSDKQAEGVIDKKIAFYKIVIKIKDDEGDAGDKIVVVKDKFDHSDLARLDGDNTFSKPVKSSAAQDVNTADGTELIKKDALVKYLTEQQFAKLNQPNTFVKKIIVTEAQDLGTASADEVAKAGAIKTFIATQKFAKIDGANTFTQAVKSSAEQSLDTADNNEFVKMQTLKGAGFLKAAYAETAPGDDALQDGVLYLVKAQ